MPLHRRLCHWGPIVALSVVGLITMPAVYCHLMWWPLDSCGGFIHLSLFMFLNYLTVSNLMESAAVGPGYVPLGWHPDNVDYCDSVQWCSICSGYKAPRSHHCRKCGRCVMKMDHHCPWINNCTGHRNHLGFIKFLMFAVIGCMQASYILGSSIWYGLFRLWYLYYGTGREPAVELTIYSLLAGIFGFGLALGVIVAVGFLFFVQVRSVLRNRTGVEDYIVAKAEARRGSADLDDDGSEADLPPFVYPYDLGWKENARQVLSWRWGARPLGDGLRWPVASNCDQYTLTREQLAQKADKKLLAREYIAVRPYDGGRLCSLCWRHGCVACCCQPLAEEARLALEPGDRLKVTRGTKRWLYGEPADGKGESAGRRRGWFPKACVRRLDEVLVPTPHNGKAD